MDKELWNIALMAARYIAILLILAVPVVFVVFYFRDKKKGVMKRCVVCRGYHVQADLLTLTSGHRKDQNLLVCRFCWMDYAKPIA